ncbi:MAG: hypothetical protein ACOZAJ_02725 [Patescibacteria group bacterium]
MFNPNKFRRYLVPITMLVLALVAGSAYAATTIGTNVSTGGTLAVTGVSTLTGNVTLGGTINKLTLTAPATGATLTIADGKTLTASNTLTFTGTDASSVAFGTGGTVAYTANNLSIFAATTSAQLAGVISDETGTGLVVLATGPAFSGQIKKSVQAGITAFAGGGQASAVAITADIAEVTTVATAADSVKLPDAVAGLQVTVINKAAVNSMALFPATGDAINETAANTAYNIAAKVKVICSAIDATNWECQKMAR